MVRSDNMNDIGVILLIIIIIIVSILIIEDWHFVQYYALQVRSKRKKKIGKMEKEKTININQNTDGEPQVQCQYLIVGRGEFKRYCGEQREEHQNINDINGESKI